MKTVYQDENNVVLVENSVELKPCINRESKSDDLTTQLYNCHDINMKFLVVVTPPSIYQESTHFGTNTTNGKTSSIDSIPVETKTPDPTPLTRPTYYSTRPMDL